MIVSRPRPRMNTTLVNTGRGARKGTGTTNMKTLRCNMQKKGCRHDVLAHRNSKSNKSSSGSRGNSGSSCSSGGGGGGNALAHSRAKFCL